MKPGRFLWLRRLIFITPEPGEPPSRLPFGDAGSLALGQIVEERKVSLENALEQAGHGTWSLTDFTYRRKDVPSSAEPAIRPISDLIYGGHFPTSLTERIVDELHLARASLLGEHPEIFAEIDRLSSEGEFRRQVSAPLLALGVVLTVRSLWWLGLIMWAATGILVVSGRAQSRRSNESLVDAIRLGRARTPSLDRVDESIKAIRTSEGGAAAPASNTETGLVPQASSSVAAVSEKAVLQPELSLAESARSSEKAGETSGETDVGDIAVMNETSDRNEAGERRDGRLGF